MGNNLLMYESKDSVNNGRKRPFSLLNDGNDEENDNPNEEIASHRPLKRRRTRKIQDSSDESEEEVEPQEVKKEEESIGNASAWMKTSCIPDCKFPSDDSKEMLPCIECNEYYHYKCLALENTDRTRKIFRCANCIRKEIAEEIANRRMINNRL